MEEEEEKEEEVEEEEEEKEKEEKEEEEEVEEKEKVFHVVASSCLSLSLSSLLSTFRPPNRKRYKYTSCGRFDLSGRRGMRTSWSLNHSQERIH